MKKKTITQRWLINNIGFIFIILVAINIGFGVFVQNYYYSTVRQYLNSKLNMITSILTRYSQDSTVNISSEIRKIVENFSDKDKMELMAIGNDGMIITSSGFISDWSSGMKDYESAIKSETGKSHYIGKMENGEKILAVSDVLTVKNSGFDVIRVVVSLNMVDKRILTYILTLSGVSLIVLLLMFFSGLYFVQSIVMPVRQIGITARKFAKGDFSVRIQKKNDDEIGELCDIINHMANELSEAEKVKNDFVSSVSHELRTPLTAIRGWSETISAMPDDLDTIQKGMHVISNETERLSQMVEELLDFSRIQNGKFSLNKSKMDILAELGDAVMMYNEKAKQENIKIVYSEPQMLPFVYGDKNRIRQVFINIIDNAIKYSDSGGIVSISAEEDIDKIRITVADNGCGIRAADLPKIKTKFYKANHTRRGSGIGLAVADEIVTMHDGSIRIISEENVGTTVVITLPIIAPLKAALKVTERKEINE